MFKVKDILGLIKSRQQIIADESQKRQKIRQQFSTKILFESVNDDTQ
ncbi:hypothetical protein RFF73_00090 [Streptococcus ruminantium]|nr:hypothetical protein [Streptococcus ruminantium]